MNARSAPPALRLAALAAVAAGCAEEPGAAVLAPEDVEIRWNEAFNGVDDQLAAFVPVDIMVYSPLDGEPLSDVLVIASTDGAVAGDATVAFLLPQSVEAADPEGCGDEPGGAPCFGVTWDAWNDLYVAVEGIDGVAPGEMRLWTDEDGLARVVVAVDSFPADDSFLTDNEGGAFEPVVVELSLGGAPGEGDVSFSLTPR